MSIENFPDWFGRYALATLAAVGGFLGKTIVDLVRSARGKKQHYHAELVQLQNLLNESWEIFATQNRLAQRLLGRLRNRNLGDTDGMIGYEKIFSKAFDSFTEEEKDLHEVIRGITKTSMFRVNQQMKEWCKRNNALKAGRLSISNIDDVSTKIKQMEHHLDLWLSKYHVWIEGHENHALVYMDDEHKHGIGFPKGINEIIDLAIEELE
ncbi:MAG: hypothetical protein FVQ82_01505 [Planctomycetes bacterium]|nr:hypothetical protein [Planctomycetota bacterium]